MFNSIIGGNTASRYLGSDNDPLFMLRRRKANLRILEENSFGRPSLEKALWWFVSIASERLE
ncbi:MAG: hypothetical protein WD795_08915 [Woeseia sp.]